jgi:two-component system, NtrC family, sensor kinase
VGLEKNTDGSYPASAPADEAGRLQALRQYHLLDTLPEAVFDDLTFIASQICDTPIALVSLIDQDRQWFKSRVGLDATETPRDMAFCAHAILEPEKIFQIADASQDPRFDTNPLVIGGPEIRFYAGVPLVTPEGHAVGTLCAIDRKPRVLSDAQLRSLQALAREITVQLELRRTIATLQAELAGAAAKPIAAARNALGESDDRIRALLARMQQLQKR